MSASHTPWSSTTSAERYLTMDIAAARNLVEQISLPGRPLRWLTSTDDPHVAQVARAMILQLREFGFEMELIELPADEYEEARRNPAQWDLHLAWHSNQQHPSTQLFNDGDFPGWWRDRRKEELVSTMFDATDADAERAAIDEWTSLIWTTLPFLKLADLGMLRARRRDVIGLQARPEWVFWNVGRVGSMG